VRVRAVAVVLLAACAGEAPAPADRAADGTSAPSVPGPEPAPSAPERTPALDSLLAAVEAETGGVLGVAAVHVESGRRLEHGGATPLPMASTVKLPVAMAVLSRVDAGEMRLDDTVRLGPDDYRFGPAAIERELGPRGGATTIGRLLEAMMVESDNAATDALIALLGGPGQVELHLRSRRIEDIRVDRSEGEIGRDYRADRDGFSRDPRDTATARAMALLLVQLQAGEGLAPESRERLLDAMRRSPTGSRRIRAGVPGGTPVATKTGTLGSTTNDVGIVRLPDGTHLAIAVLVARSRRPNAAVEPAIARVAGGVYEHFTGR
jgi:beta-lactamase class A